MLSGRRDLGSALRFFTRALGAGTIPAEVAIDRAPVYLRVVDELVPSALHTVEQYANNLNVFQECVGGMNFKWRDWLPWY